MSNVFPGISFLFFAGVSFVHFLGLYRVAAVLRPEMAPAAAVGLALLWAGFLGLLLWGAFRNRLVLPFCVVFAYIMFFLLAGTQILPGVPAKAADGRWKDPQGLLTPGTQYLLHNHSVVVKPLSREEYDAYSFLVICYFSSGLMVIPAVILLRSLDRDKQLNFRGVLPRRGNKEAG